MENLGQQNNKHMSLNLIAEYGSSDSDSGDSPSIDNLANDDVGDRVGFCAMVLKNNIINASSHGPLRNPTREATDSSTHMIIGNADSGVVEYEVTEYRNAENKSDSSSSSDSSDSDVDSVKDIEEISASDEDSLNGQAEKAEAPRVRGELGIKDLPPIEELAISLPVQNVVQIGCVANIVDELVIVSAQPDTPALDLDSVLFLDKGAKVLGKVFDVFGPVNKPYYCVRFNSEEHVKERGVQPGMLVYFAPKTPHTNFVFLSALMRMKGSDASWMNDVEPPPHQIEFSDDEEERQYNRQRKEQKKQESESGDVAERKKPQEQTRKNHRPSESSSRFGGSGNNNRALHPFMGGARKNNSNTFNGFGHRVVPWSGNYQGNLPPGIDMRSLPMPPGLEMMQQPGFEMRPPPGGEMRPPQGMDIRAPPLLEMRPPPGLEMRPPRFRNRPPPGFEVRPAAGFNMRVPPGFEMETGIHNEPGPNYNGSLYQAPGHSPYTLFDPLMPNNFMNTNTFRFGMNPTYMAPVPNMMDPHRSGRLSRGLYGGGHLSHGMNTDLPPPPPPPGT